VRVSAGSPPKVAATEVFTLQSVGRRTASRPQVLRIDCRGGARLLASSTRSAPREYNTLCSHLLRHEFPAIRSPEKRVFHSSSREELSHRRRVGRSRRRFRCCSTMAAGGRSSATHRGLRGPQCKPTVLRRLIRAVRYLCPIHLRGRIKHSEPHCAPASTGVPPHRSVLGHQSLFLRRRQGLHTRSHSSDRARFSGPNAAAPSAESTILCCLKMSSIESQSDHDVTVEAPLLAQNFL